MRALSEILASTISALESVLKEAFEAGRAQGIIEGEEAFRQKLAGFLKPQEGYRDGDTTTPAHPPVHYQEQPNDGSPGAAENVKQVTWSTRLPA